MIDVPQLRRGTALSLPRVADRRARRSTWRRLHRAFTRWWWRTRFRRAQILGRAALAAFSVIATLAAGEIVLRVRYRPPTYDMRADLARANRSRPPRAAADCSHAPQASLGDLVRPSAAPDIVYEFKPNLDTCFYGARIHINADGLRARAEYARPKPPGVYRVLLLGDSMTFGQGLRDEDTFATLLERELSAGGITTEVINSGVPGYNTAQEAAYLRRTGMSYEPDCVLILFIGNDLGLPHLMLRPRRAPIVAGSHLLGAIDAALNSHAFQRAASDWFDIATGPTSFDVSPEEMDRVPDEYRYMVGEAGYRRALRLIRETAGPRIPVVNFADYSSNRVDADGLVQFQRQIGIAHPDFAYPAENRCYQSADDHHMNVEGARQLAIRMVAGLRSTGVCLPRGP